MKEARHGSGVEEGTIKRYQEEDIRLLARRRRVFE